MTWVRQTGVRTVLFPGALLLAAMYCTNILYTSSTSEDALTTLFQRLPYACGWWSVGEALHDSITRL